MIGSKEGAGRIYITRYAAQSPGPPFSVTVLRTLLPADLAVILSPP